MCWYLCFFSIILFSVPVYAYVLKYVPMYVKVLQTHECCVLCTALSTGVWLLLGLSAFSVTYSDKQKQTGWSYSIGWVAFLLCAVAAVYFIAAGIVRLRCKRQMTDEGEDADYQPLQQVESAGTHSSDSSDNDDR